GPTAAAFAAVLALAGCDGGTISTEPPAPAPVASVDVQQDSVILVADQSTRLVVVVRDSAGRELAGRRVSWSVRNLTATRAHAGEPPSVDSTGVVSGRGWSRAMVTATSEGKSDSVMVLAEPRVDSVGWTWSAPEMAPGVTFSVLGKVPYAGDGILRQVTLEPGDLPGGRWTSSDTSVVSLAVAKPQFFVARIVLTARRAGESTVTYSFGGKSISQRVVVRSPTLVAPDGRERCGLTADGEAWCRGENQRGQLGTLTAPQVEGRDTWEQGTTAPVRVRGGLRFTALTSGTDHSCALTSDGRAYCWGDNEQGQLGAESGTARCQTRVAETFRCSFEPLPVRGGLTFRSIQAAGAETCGVATDGISYCWGGSYGATPTRRR
ncbi:MAG TPA: hypothetical protein VF263_03530, partial [Longimicrobiaceae bacterium]